MKKNIIAIFLLSIISISAIAKESPEAILSLLSNKIKNFVAEEPYVYDDPALGASRGYNAYAHTPDFVAVTIYLYDLGIDNIKNGIESEAISEQKKQCMAIIDKYVEEGHYKNVKVLKEGTTEVDVGQSNPLKIISVSYSYDTVDDQNPNISTPVISDLLLVALRGHICKIRITKPHHTSTEINNEINELIKTLLIALKS